MLHAGSILAVILGEPHHEIWKSQRFGLALRPDATTQSGGQAHTQCMQPHTAVARHMQGLCSVSKPRRLISIAAGSSKWFQHKMDLAMHWGTYTYNR